MSSSGSDDDHVLTKRGERRVFLFVAVFLFPALSVILIGGYGFLIWILQLIFGNKAFRFSPYVAFFCASFLPCLFVCFVDL